MSTARNHGRHPTTDDLDAETHAVWRNLAAFPNHASCTLTTAQTRDFLLATSGWIMAAGKSWDIVTKRLGAGVYRISLKERL